MNAAKVAYEPVGTVLGATGGMVAGALFKKAGGYETCVPVRDSKVPQGQAVVFPAEAWRSFVGALSESP